MLGSVQAHSARAQEGSIDLSIRCPTAGQRSAATALRATIGQRQPLIVVFGDSGSGKTALINGVLGSMDSQQFAALNFSATGGEFSNVPNFDEILELICRRLGAAKVTQRRPETLAVLSAAINDLAGKGQTLLLVIDHADHLTVDVIAELSQFTDYLDVPENRIVRIFVGSMALASRIDTVLRQLGVDQRLSEIRLSPPSAEEVAALLAYEDSAQKGGPMLTSGAIDRISAYAKSNLHWAMPMADAARVFAEGEGKREVTAEMVRSVLLEIWSPEQTLSTNSESLVGLSDSVSRSPALGAAKDFDVPGEFSAEDRLTSNTTRKSPPAPERRSAERLAPIAAISLFVVGTIVLAALDNRVRVTFQQPETAVDAAKQTQPLESSGIVREDITVSEQAKQLELQAGAAPGDASQNPKELGIRESAADPATQDPSTSTAAVDPKAEMYGPWPENGAHSNEPSTAMPEAVRSDLSKTGPAVEKPHKAKTPRPQNKTVLKPTDVRPADLTSKHWIQER